MIDGFLKTRLGHAAVKRLRGDAAVRVLPAKDFAKARDEISRWDGYAPTPLVTLEALSARIGVGTILYKDEGPRFGLGSFKALGGSYAAQCLLQREISGRIGETVALADVRTGKLRKHCKDMTLVSATDGNHGRSLAWGCRRFGAACRIYIHAEVSEGRAAAIRNLGAAVIRVDGDYDASVAEARRDAGENGWFVVSDTSWPGYARPPRDVMAGYGVMAREICDALDEAPTHVFLQGGVGGLAAGTAAAFRQHWAGRAPRAIIVEPESAACLYASALTGRATTITVTEESVMAGLSCGEPSELAWEILREEASDALTLPESVIAPTMRLLARPFADDPAIEAGETGVAGLAALIAARLDGNLSEVLGLDSRARVLLIGSEGVTDPAVFRRIMEGSDAA